MISTFNINYLECTGDYLMKRFHFLDTLVKRVINGG